MNIHNREHFGEQALSLAVELAALVRDLAKATPQEAAAEELCSKAVSLEMARMNNAMLERQVRRALHAPALYGDAQ